MYTYLERTTIRQLEPEDEIVWKDEKDVLRSGVVKREPEQRDLAVSVWVTQPHQTHEEEVVFPSFDFELYVVV